MTQISLQGSMTIGPYKGYHGRADYDADERAFHGQVTDTKDVITFVGKDPSEIESAFKESVDDYLQFCAERGEKPDKPFSGRFIVRTTPGLHNSLHKCAEDCGKSLNQFVVDALEGVVKEHRPRIESEAFTGTLVAFPHVQSIEWSAIDPGIIPVSISDRLLGKYNG